MQQVGDDVFLVPGTAVNWVIVRQGRDLTLIDCGYPGDAEAVVSSIESIGHRTEDVRAVLLTHAHVDHLGAAGLLWERHRTPVHVHPLELANARGFRHQSATALDVALRVWKPRVAKWARTITRAGASEHVTVDHATPYPEAGPLDLPGRPTPIHSPGHTSGHAAYLLAGGVLATGDALVTGHPLSISSGPQMLPRFFSHDPEQADATLDVLAVADADTIVPGHGAIWRGDPAEAVAMAREHAQHGRFGTGCACSGHDPAESSSSSDR